MRKSSYLLLHFTVLIPSSIHSACGSHTPFSPNGSAGSFKTLDPQIPALPTQMLCHATHHRDAEWDMPPLGFLADHRLGNGRISQSSADMNMTSQGSLMWTRLLPAMQR